MIRLPIAFIAALIVATGNNVVPNQTPANQIHIPIVIAPEAEATATSTPIGAPTPTLTPTPTATSISPCTPKPFEVTAVDTRLRRSDLPSQFDAQQEGDPQYQVDGVRLSSRAAIEFSGDSRYGPGWIRNEVGVYCSTLLAAEAFQELVETVKKDYPTREEHQLEIGEQTLAFSVTYRNNIMSYSLVFRQGNIVVIMGISGFEDVIDLETIEDLGDAVSARLEQ